ncbi:hypothetical protein AJ80_04275 [Polytolypa hystricis UAMH7299]|uniref:Uncharacterized protein n=1 Tax=Polytolypa hystricis (strain UAMH7299) TaxID=1447883 RepID=A0A2B7YDG9_POLH7|nr:hypothetical protein AJ80_04275 [Polytolypa hystricis UAMH7299]
MYAARAAKPKLSISIASATTSASRPALSLKSPASLTVPPRTPRTPRTPLSATPLSPTARNTRLNQQGLSTMQIASFSYANSSSSKSILKKSSSAAARGKSIQFNGEPTVHCVTPIENPDYYGGYVKLSKDERRWMKRS